MLNVPHFFRVHCPLYRAILLYTLTLNSQFDFTLLSLWSSKSTRTIIIIQVCPFAVHTISQLLSTTYNIIQLELVGVFSVHLFCAWTFNWRHGFLNSVQRDKLMAQSHVSLISWNWKSIVVSPTIYCELCVVWPSAGQG